MPFCTSCGQPLKDADRFCTFCGAPREHVINPPSLPQDKEKIEPSPPQDPEKTQPLPPQNQKDIQPSESQYQEDMRPLPPQARDEIRWTAKVLGMASDFFVNTEGAGQAASKTTSNVNTGLAVGGSLLGSFAAAGAGILAKSRENDFIRWDETRSVALNTKKKTVTVTRKSLVFPIRLYCTAENYEQVAIFIRQHVDNALVKE
jgi:hypothetical protein